MIFSIDLFISRRDYIITRRDLLLKTLKCPVLKAATLRPFSSIRSCMNA